MLRKNLQAFEARVKLLLGSLIAIHIPYESGRNESLGTVKSAPIIENDAFSRMRELAGIKKSN
jgi:hypothetical protein